MNFIKSGEYQYVANGQSRKFASYFIIFCLYFRVFERITIGYWWFPFFILGLFGSSLIFACLATLLEIRAALIKKEIWNVIAIKIIDISFLVLLFFATKYSLLLIRD